MREPTVELTKQAQSIFDQLGYTVIEGDEELRAERDWKVVQVTPTQTGDQIPTDGSLRCFVTPRANADALRDKLRGRELSYEWAVIGIGEDDYEVTRAPPGPRAS